MKRPSLITVLVLSVCFVSTQVAAQTGLRFNKPVQNKASNPAPALQLHYSGIALYNNAPNAGPAFSSAGSSLQSNNDDTSASRDNTVWADWRPFDNSLRTSAGLMWRNAVAGERNNTADIAVNDLDARNRLSTPFVGLGWLSEPSREAPWRLSAEVGTYLTGNGDCHNALLSCGLSSGMGLKPSSTSDEGLSWKPYFSLGASFRY